MVDSRNGNAMTNSHRFDEETVVFGVCRRMEPLFRRAAEELPGVEVRGFPDDCRRSFVEWRVLDKALGGVGSTATVVLGGQCLRRLGPPPRDYSRWRTRVFDRCVAVVTGAGTLALLDAFGVALHLPGDSAEAAPAGEPAVIDSAGPAECAATVAALTVPGSPPPRVVEPDIERLRRRLVRMADERRADTRQARLNELLAGAYKQTSERVLTLDYVGELAEMLVEERAVERFFDLTTILLAPRRMAYAAFEEGKPPRFLTRPPGSYSDDEVSARLTGFEQNLLWDGERGARLALRHRGRVLGAVDIDDIGRPDRRDAVTDLVLTAGRICGLAVSNARLYRDLSGPDRGAGGCADDLQDALDARERAEERQAQLARELEEANRELEQFAYVVSHDLKAPLRGVDSLAKWLVQDVGDRLGPEAAEHLRLMRDQTERMRSLIDGILQYSRAGRSREERTAVDLATAVPEVIELLAPPAHVRIEIESQLPTVTAEKTRLEQVFANLISNAVKYMDKPQGLVRVGCADDGDYWRFWVGDNGPGIAPEDHERIFGLFQTGQPREAVDSTGIGLSVVKRVVTMFGGRVWLDSRPGLGTTFFFTWPKELQPE
jgi:signal transduction histidine kinase